MRQLVSIGIPFYNAQRTLRDAIRSVFAQTYQEWELILVDDGSVDGSLEIAESVRDSRIRVVSDGKNMKLPTRLNQIAEIANGALLARMDADDLMHPARLERQVAFMTQNPGVDIMGSGATIIDQDGAPQGWRGCCSHAPSPRDVLDSGMFIHPTVMMRTRWAREHPYAPKFIRAEDLELWNRSYGNATTGCLPESLLFYREARPINLTAYRESQRTKRRILWKYGPERVGYISTAWLVWRTHMREMLYNLGRLTGLTNWWVQMRSSPLSQQEIHAARVVIEEVYATSVPGFSNE